MRARYYEPSSGRFVSEDPARDGANWLSYCGGDPVNKVDANGKEDTYPEVNKWVGVVSDLIVMLNTAYLNPVARAKALSDISFLLAWFSLDMRSTFPQEGDLRVLGAFLLFSNIDLIVAALNWGSIGGSLLGSHPAIGVVAMFAEHAAFFSLFMSLEDIASNG
jgi:uncharacterized protein RhaS with RHS repeats